MSQGIDAIITIGSTWTDLTVTYTSLASVDSWVKNRGPGQVECFYSSSASAPTNGSGYLMDAPGAFGGNAAHVWVRSLNSSSNINIGLS